MEESSDDGDLRIEKKLWPSSTAADGDECSHRKQSRFNFQIA